MAVHGHVRATGDLDIWVRPTPENATRVWRAVSAYGAPLHQLTPNDFAEPEVVFQIGEAPHRIDLLTSITGVDFEDAWQERVETMIDELTVLVLGREELIRNKQATGRMQDLADVEALEGLPKDRHLH